MVKPDPANRSGMDSHQRAQESKNTDSVVQLAKISKKGNSINKRTESSKDKVLKKPKLANDEDHQQPKTWDKKRPTSGSDRTRNDKRGFKPNHKNSGKSNLKSKDKPDKKDYREQLYERRKENGIWLLSKKEEDKIYRVKKAMRKKGASPDEIKNEVRQMRRHMELQQKKTEKHCFKCRKMGHMAADCKTSDPNQTGKKRKGSNKDDLVFGMDQAKICYRCGSTEHSLIQCKMENDDLPFASCYICGEKGHLSRNCSKNTRGVYPKGGSCKKCNSIYHLIKDCPEQIPLEAEVPDLTVKAMDSHSRPDIEEYDLPSDRSSNKKQKVVQF